MNEPSSPQPWSLGAVLAERPVDPRTHLLVIRADADAAAARELEQRLFGLRLAGTTTVIMDVTGAERMSGAILAALVRARRKLEWGNGRLVVTAERPEARRVLECAGLEVLRLDGALDDAPSRRATGSLLPAPRRLPAGGPAAPTAGGVPC